MARQDPLRGFRYLVEIDGIASGAVEGGAGKHRTRPPWAEDGDMIASRRLALAACAAAARFTRRRSRPRSATRLPGWLPLSLRWTPRRKRLSAKPAVTGAVAAGLG